MDGNQTNIEITNEETGDEFTFNAASLVSDVRDILLDHRRKQLEATVWGKLKESEQRDQINAMNNLAFMLINKIVDVVATGNQVCAYVEVSKFAVDVEKGVVTITSAGSASDDMLTDLAHAKGRQCRLTVLDSSQFNVDRRDVEPEPDQPGMFTDEDEAPAASEPLKDDDEIIDPETGEITSTADAMAQAIENDPKATDDEKATLYGDNATVKADTETAAADSVTHPADTTTEAEPEAEPAQASADTKTAPNGDDDAPDAYQEGIEAAANNLGPDECTYDGGTDEHHKWHQGRNKGLDLIEEMRQQGREARTDGMAPTRCTWKKGTRERDWWMEGYEQVKATENS